MATVAATRSHDAQTKVGCVIVKDNRIIGTGYNGFPPDMPDYELPTTRPEKYKWILHAEENALSNCSKSPEGGISYTTGKPCLRCAKLLYAAGIKTFVCGNQAIKMLDDPDHEEVLDMLVKHGGVKIRHMDHIESVDKVLMDIFNWSCNCERLQ